jgi:YHS domain-containing protein
MFTLSRRNAVRFASLVAVAQLATSLPSYAEASAPLAIKGYDPVAYFTVGKPTPGLPQFESEYAHRTYHFANAKDLDLFKADPAHYAPQYSGQCALDLADGKVSPVIPEAWLIREGKLYLFGAPQGPGLFQENFAEHVEKANGNRSLIPTP